MPIKTHKSIEIYLPIQNCKNMQRINLRIVVITYKEFLGVQIKLLVNRQLQKKQNKYLKRNMKKNQN